MDRGVSRFACFVPMKLIGLKYPGGVEQCRKDHEASIGKSAWFHDTYLQLCVDTVYEVDALVDQWADLGFIPFADNPLRWDEMCVLPPSALAPLLPCWWLNVSGDVSEGRCIEVMDSGKAPT